jgi:hypothetical protein
MGQQSFRRRLESAAQSGKMTTADLSVWFARPYATVRGWLTNPHHYVPWGPDGDEAQRLLTILERAIKRKDGFPVPLNLAPLGRRLHVTRMRHELDGRLSPTRAAR